MTNDAGTAEKATEPSRPASWLTRWWWLWLALLWVVVGLLFTAQTVWLAGLPWEIGAQTAIIDWGPWIVLSYPVLWLSRRVQISGQTWKWAVPAHLVGALVVALIIELFSAMVVDRYRNLFWFQMPPPPPPQGQGMEPPRDPEFRRQPPEPGEFRIRVRPNPDAAPGDREMIMRLIRSRENRGFVRRFLRARLSIPIYFLLVAAAHAMAYHHRSLDRERRALLAEARLAEARLMALQMQLQPHFFFNALNTVASLVHTRPEQADEMICALGELMRGVLDASNRRAIALREELAFVDRYLAVQRVRFGDRLQVVHEIDAGALDCLTPTLLLQPLVENAVVHGVAPQPTAGKVTLGARRVDGRVVVSVTNTGAAGAGAREGRRLQFSERVGLSNTRARLEALYGGDFRFELFRTADGGVRAEVELPWRRAET